MSVIVPVEEIPEDSLKNLITAFVLREGTDYGEHEVALETKIQQVLAVIKRGDAQIVFSELEESFDIVSKADLQTMMSNDYQE
ncbi:YheU family protein [Planctobacterium marinum]|uniref:UPF0270 protein n=1 Tax=Planctobacterium marinum TaxID=1631968 RepID=A0AA48HCN5_9ALTE|nr:UPF0270 protein [Planctobacterium marinum]